MRQSLRQTRYISERLTKHRQFEVNTFVVESIQDFKQRLGILVMFPTVAHSTNISTMLINSILNQTHPVTHKTTKLTTKAASFMLTKTKKKQNC